MTNAYHKSILEHVDRCEAFAQFVGRGLEPGAFARFLGLAGSARALVVGRMAGRLNRPVLVVTHDAETAEAWFEDFEHFGVAAHLFPMAETLPYEIEEPVMGIIAHQYLTLRRLMDDAADAVVIVPIEALQRRVLPKEAFGRHVLEIAWGETFETEAMSLKLVAMGYERQAMAESRGEFAIRGHIVDIYPPDLDHPVRLDLFGDEIESMRFFEASTQRSLPEGKELESVTILPVSVCALAEREARAGTRLVGLESWMDDETVAVLDSPDRFGQGLEQFDRIAARRFKELSGAEAMPETPEFASAEAGSAHVGTFDGEAALEPGALYLNEREVERLFERFAQVHVPSLDVETTLTEDETGTFNFGVSSYDSIPSDVDTYLSVIRKRQSQDFSVHIVCDNEGQVTRLEELLAEREIAARSVLPGSDSAENYEEREILKGFQEVVVTTGAMHTGFIFPQARLLIVTDREMFGRYKRRHVRRKPPKGRAIRSMAEMQRGDYVVHADHGIGQFLGVRHQKIDGRETELLEIAYAEGNKLLVPIESVQYVQKYTSVEGAQPSLDTMGGKRWKTRKRKSQERVEQMARELLDVYAKREVAQGHAFGDDTVWMREFEESFFYTETGDQLRSIDEIKRDMMSPKPMDRLLCGDVGFGKTEVAMRAAFKCVQDKKQVAVLAPTTVLVQQHFNTFRERFADYPVSIEMISRFRTATETRETTKRCKDGTCDIVVGTHRLLSKDVQFMDLGLLIVDEEHRFGVKQKEKIKSLRAEVDILTLSATPIPRTLHLALSGLRDMSTINTPPRDRLPIRTRVIRFVPEEIEEAVVRELNRGGQIYFVHNRVQSIQGVAERLQEIVPQARIAVGHGQMSDRELEKVMLDFVDHQSDILVATTIIESGLDIPNVNTIIINRADAFGLAQLYQLRGRVGRDVKRAYAYLIIPEGRPITDTAIKRLRAIEEFTDLGTGFQIAMRDLEIRGTGNILGAEQHGTMEAIGFELYCQMLEEAVQRVGDGHAPVVDFPVEIKWSAPAYLPADYVPVESQRVAFYKRCGTAREVRDLDDLRAELRDRYGKTPAPAANLLDVARLRIVARDCSVEKITAGRKGMKMTPRGDVFDFLRRAMGLQETDENVDQVSAEADGSVLLKMRDWDPGAGLGTAFEVLEKLQAGGAN